MGIFDPDEWEMANESEIARLKQNISNLKKQNKAIELELSVLKGQVKSLYSAIKVFQEKENEHG